MAISLTKTIPTASTFSGYTTGGATTITLDGAYQVIVHTKKTPIKINKRQGPNKWSASPSDKFTNEIKDLKFGEDEIIVRGWMDDDDTLTAWEKVWKLRAMIVSGGPLTSFILDNITYDDTTQQCYLLDMTSTIKANDTGDLDTNKGDGVARIDVSLTLYIADQK